MTPGYDRVMTNTATTTARAGTNATSISRCLRRAGFLPVPTRRHTGLYVTGSYLGVSVTAQIDHPAEAARLAADAAAVLTEAGYTVTVNPHDDAIFSVAR